MQHILMIEDELAVEQMVRQRLERDGFALQHAATGEAGLHLLGEQAFDALLLDVGLPGIDGFEVLRRARAAGQTLPVIMLTARGDEIDRVVGLELGADDYVPKPFSPRELVARLRALLRRTAEVQALRLQASTVAAPTALQIDDQRRSATYHGAALDLRPREFDLLHILATHPQQVWTRDALLRRVWGSDQHIDARTVDVHIRRLRAKLSEAAPGHDPIQTEWGVGYRFAPD